MPARRMALGKVPMVSRRRLCPALGCILAAITLLVKVQSQEPSPSAPDLSSLLVRVNANMTENFKCAQQYTSDELWHNVNYDKNGKKTEDESAKFENIFVEGLPYRRKVEANGKPLDPKEAAAELKRYDQAVEQRRAMTTDEKRHTLHLSFHSSFPLCCLAKDFNNRIVGHESIEGRDMLVVESEPKPDAHPFSEEEKSALDWRETTWIDTADAMPARIRVESLKDRGHFAKGMTMTLEFTRVIDQPADVHPERAVWLESGMASKFQFKMLWFGASGTTDETYSNFKKFHGDMRILEDSVQEVTPQPAKNP